ncbi:MAG TPA: helix-turn-helix transcriptional regulator [Steroidobacteraceae bacterium]|nr:helix-turn-helix transcriptional regulator [Steroidobacteraceae bacterium]
MPQRIADKPATFDAVMFYEAIERTRQARKLTWRQVATGAGVSASTLTRIAQGKRPDVDSLAALAAWARLDSGVFMRPAAEQPGRSEPLAMISTYLRSDPNLSDEAATALDELIKATYERLRKDR